MMLGLVAIIAARMSRAGWDRVIPKFAVSAIFIWHFIGLGLLSLIGITLVPILVGHRIISNKTGETCSTLRGRRLEPSRFCSLWRSRLASGIYVWAHRTCNVSAESGLGPGGSFCRLPIFQLRWTE